MAERLKASEWEVRPVAIDVARRLVRTYHYARGASNTATYLHGLFRAGSFWEEDCLGCAWWIPPTRSAAEATYPKDWCGVLSLSRLVVAPEVPTNGASYLIGRSMRLIDRERWPCLVTYADEWRGHSGAIYLAANWTPVGKTAPESTWVLNGRMLSRKAGDHTRTAAEMRDLGAELAGRFRRRKFVHVLNSVRVSAEEV
jgi:hypothetical protein